MEPRKKRKRTWPTIEARPGVVLRHRTTGHVGSIVSFAGHQVTIRDKNNREHRLPVAAGAFSYKGQTVTLVRPAASAAATQFTASGSIKEEKTKARQAIGSRILVEGLHDAELVEKVWGADLRGEGVVVLPLHGADDLAAEVASFSPSDNRRLGILLDHLVSNTKESYIAATVNNPHVLITGHEYVDVWQAIRPQVIGIKAWPQIPKGTDWKTGIKEFLGFKGETGVLWKHLLSQVSSYRDLEPSLVGAVEQLIDFVAPPPQE